MTEVDDSGTVTETLGIELYAAWYAGVRQWPISHLETAERVLGDLVREHAEELHVLLGPDPQTEMATRAAIRRAEREATDAAAARRVVERLERENAELRKKCGE